MNIVGHGAELAPGNGRPGRTPVPELDQPSGQTYNEGIPACRGGGPHVATAAEIATACFAGGLNVSSCLLVTVCLVGAQPVDAPDVTDLASTVRQLVRQLDDDDVQRREEAEKRLLSLGSAVLDHLPPVSREMSPEVKIRLMRARNLLERKATSASTNASTVTLKGAMLLSEALASLEQQTGNKLVDYRERFGQKLTDPPVTCDFDGAEYWRVLDDVLDQSQLQLYSFSGTPHTLAFVAQPPNRRPARGRVAYAGPFRFEATRIEAVRDLRSPENEGLRIGLEISWEPRLQPIAITQSLQSFTAVDDQGKTLAMDQRRSVLESPVQTTVGAVEMDIPLKLPARSTVAIASLRGTMAAVLPGREVEFQFDNLQTAKNVEQRNAGVTVVLETVRKNAAVYEVRIRVRFDRTSGALESHRGWIFNNKAYMIDADGNREENAGLETTSQRPDEVGVSYKFILDKDLQDYTFAYKTAAAIVKVPVEYELTDLRLP